MPGNILIAVDIGNSSTKVGWFADAAPQEDAKSAEVNLPQPTGTLSFATGQSPASDLASRLPPGPCAWHIASVHREGTRVLAQWVQSQRPGDEVLVLDFHDLPIEVRVDFPERVGLDRLAAAVGANVLREKVAGTLRMPLELGGCGSAEDEPHRPETESASDLSRNHGQTACQAATPSHPREDGTRNVPATLRPAIVVDAGSAITVDLVSADGAFCGGVIMPGFKMAAEALFGTADQLPLALLEPQDQSPPVVGQNTEAAIRSGLFWGAVGAVREIVERMARDLDPQPLVYVTGGDLRQLAQHIGHEARFVPNMVLAGIAIAVRSRPGKGKA